MPHTPNEPTSSTHFTASTPPTESAQPQFESLSADSTSAKKSLSPQTFARRLFRFDMALLLIMLVLAFFLGSFTAHNTDVFLHLGQESPFAGDAAETHWVHHAWLTSWLVGTVYEPLSASAEEGGRWAVLGKALVVVVFAGIMCLIRRRGGSWLLPVACTALAIVVMSPRLMLQPMVMSLLFLAVTLWVLTLPATQSARAIWFLPAMFALWVNMDQWFLLGPWTVALWLCGLLLQKRLKIALPSGGGAAAHPPLLNLAIVLGLGLAACLANPWGYRAFTLPVELAQLLRGLVPPGMGHAGRVVALIQENDPQFMVQPSPFSADYWLPSYGKHVAGFAYYVLLLLGLASFGLPVLLARPDPAGPGKNQESSIRCNLPMLAIFLCFASLSAVNFRLIPFFAVVAGPIVVLNFQDFARKRTADGLVPKPELNWAIGRRMAALATGLVLLACAWTGWLHSFADVWRGTHHVAWGVAEDPGVLEAAKIVEQIHQQTGLCKLGFNYWPEGGNLFAWGGYRTEPSLRLMCDSRFAMSADRAEAYGKIRKALRDEAEAHSGQAGRDQTEMLKRVNLSRKQYQEAMRKTGVDYVVFTGLHYDRQAQFLTQLMLVDNRQWILLFLDGRTAVFAWADPANKSAGETFQKFRLDFDSLSNPAQPPPNVPKVALDTTHLPPAPTDNSGDWHEYLYGPTKPALFWVQAKQYIDLAMLYSSVDQQKPGFELMFAGWGVAPALRLVDEFRGGLFLIEKGQQGQNKVPMFRTKDLRPPGALLVAVRAARNGVLEAPEDFKSHIGLGQAYQMLLSQEDHWVKRPPQFSMLYKPDLRHQFRLVNIISAFQNASIIQPDNFMMHDTLHGLYFGLGYFDVSLDQLAQACKSLDSHKPVGLEQIEKVKQLKETYDQRLKSFGEQVKSRQDAFARSVTPRLNAVDKFHLALFNPDKRDAKGREQVEPRGLVQQALQLLLANIDLSKDDPEKMRLMLHEIASWQLYLLLTTGQAREAHDRLKDEKVLRPLLPGGEYEELRAMAAWALGDYAAADKFLEQAEAARSLPPDEQIFEQQKKSTRQLIDHLASSAFLTPGPGGLIGPLASLGTFQTRRQEILDVLFHQAKERRDVAELRLLRGLLALELGDTAVAGQHFRGCLMIVPSAVDFPDRPIAVRYLELLEAK